MDAIATTLVNSLLVNLSVLITKPTGITTYAVNLYPYLQSLNPTLLVGGGEERFAPTDVYSIPANLTPEYGTKGHLRRILWTQLQLPRIYQKLNSRLLFSPVPEAPLFSSCRYVVTVHDLIALRFPRPFSPLSIYQRHYIPQVLAQAQHIICNSVATAQDIIDFFQVPASKITPIYLGYDAEHFRVDWEGTAEAQRSQLRGRVPRLKQTGVTQRWSKEMGGQGCPYFIYVGRHDSYKNLHRLIAAFAALPNCGDYELFLVGPSDSRFTPILKANVDELGIRDRVKFLGYVPYAQMPSLLNGAIALVFPSLWEGFGFPVLEAMACGTPVITSNLSSLPEVAGEAALLVDPYKREEISAAMHTIATDSQVRSRLSQLGLARAQQFSWAKTGLATAEVLSRYL